MRRFALHCALVGTAALALAACAPVGPDFERPAPPTVSAYRPTVEDPTPAASTQDRIADDWWRALHAPALDRLIDEAFARNPTLAEAEHTLAAAREAATAERGTRLPQIDGTASAGRQKYGKQFLGPLAAPPPFTYYGLGAAIGYRVDYLGGEARSIEQRDAESEVRRQQYRAATLTIAGNIVREALAMAQAREQLRTIEGLVADDRRNVALVQQSFDAGSGTRVDLLSAQSQLASDAALLPPARRALDASRHALAALAGGFPADTTVPEFALADFTLPESLPVSLPSTLARRRPDILAAEAQLHAATAAVGVATADLYPRITLDAGGGPQSLTLASLFDRGNLVWSLASGLAAPLFDGGTRRARQRERIDTMKASAAHYQATVLDAVRQVADALAAIEHDAEFADAQRRTLDVAEQSVDLARRSYEAGNSGVLTVLDAERIVQRARLDDLRARVQRYGDAIDLYMSLGGIATDLGAQPRSQAAL